MLHKSYEDEHLLLVRMITASVVIGPLAFFAVYVFHNSGAYKMILFVLIVC